jgi:hypothetical protein
MIDTPKQRQRLWRIAAWLMSSLFALLLITLAVAAWWLWGWQWKNELTFHESWSTEERTALTEFDNYLRDAFVTDIAAETGRKFTDEKGWQHDITRACITRSFCAPVREQLVHIAECGNANQPTFDFLGRQGCTPTIIAATTAHFGAVYALINHGAEPNAVLTLGDKEDFVELSTPIADILSGSCLNKKHKPSWNERQDLAEFLLAKGADINAHSYLVGVNCSLALTRGETAPWLWAVGHGKKVTGRELLDVLSMEKPSPTLTEAILRSTPAIANTTDCDRTPLQELAQKICNAESDEMPELEQVLDLLLAYGANPTLRPEPIDKYSDCERRLPLDILFNKRNFDTCGMDGANCEGQEDDVRTIWQRMCEKLQQ